MDRLMLLILAMLFAFPIPGSPARSHNENPAVSDDNTKIINGLSTSEFPEVAALINPSGKLFCSATLIGCKTILTAAHCVCSSDGSNCQANGQDLTSPSDIRVFLQQAGLFNVTKVDVPVNYQFGVEGDVALLKLGQPVTGIPPATINSLQKPSFGLPGTIAGFGLSDTSFSVGIKNKGKVTTTNCQPYVPNSQHLCWLFEPPIGPAGQDSNTCSGDSGGPLFIKFNGAQLLSGVTSGGLNTSCFPTELSFDADVFVNRTWITAQAGDDLGRVCTLPGEPEATNSYAASVESHIDYYSPGERHTFDIPFDTKELRFVLNGTAFYSDFDLFIKFDSPADLFGIANDCQSTQAGSFESCVISEPEPGLWHVLIDDFFSGGGAYQLNVTAFGSTAADALGMSLGYYDSAFAQFKLKQTLSDTWNDIQSFLFGPGGVDWLPLAGDWNGNGQQTVGLYDPATGLFRLRNQLAGGPADVRFAFGPPNAGWIPLSGDWNGNGQQTVGLYDPATGLFRLRNQLAGGSADVRFAFGPSNAGWIPLSGDWNGNGQYTIGLYDSFKQHFILKNILKGGKADASFSFLVSMDALPISGKWIEN